VLAPSVEAAAVTGATVPSPLPDAAIAVPSSPISLRNGASAASPARAASASAQRAAPHWAALSSSLSLRWCNPVSCDCHGLQRDDSPVPRRFASEHGVSDRRDGAFGWGPSGFRHIVRPFGTERALGARLRSTHVLNPRPGSSVVHGSSL
jgi:hypothetical protein